MKYLHRSTVKQGFVDLHNHTNYSWGREYGQIDFTPLGYLNECNEYANKFNKPVSFAITDHNNTNGNIEVLNAIKKDPEKYKNINFIPGCEYTVSTDSIGHVYDENGEAKPIISYNKLHMLAYGMDVNDPTIKYISELYNNDKRHTVEMSSAGAQAIDGSGYVEPVKYGNLVFCTKKWLKDNGMDRELSEFAKYCPIQKSFEETKKVIEKFLAERVNVPKNKMGKWNEFVSDPKNLRKYVKADIQEVMSAVENAGGYTVLAHPIYCDPSRELQQLNTKDPRNAIYKDISYVERPIGQMTPEERKEHAKKYNKYYEFIFRQLTEKAHDPVTGKKLEGLVGYELMHCANQKNSFRFEAMKNAGDKMGLYCTAGSDSHGSLHHYCIPSRVVGPQVQNFDAVCGKEQVCFAVSRCNFVEDYIKSTKTGERLHRVPGMTANDQLTITKENKGKVTNYTVDEFTQVLNNSFHRGKTKGKGKHKLAYERLAKLRDESMAFQR